VSYRVSLEVKLIALDSIWGYVIIMFRVPVTVLTKQLA